jgi:hypothetical protein
VRRGALSAIFPGSGRTLEISTGTLVERDVESVEAAAQPVRVSLIVFLRAL